MFFDRNTNCISFKKYNFEKKFNFLFKKIQKIIFLFENIFFNKIKFKGKGFRVRFKKKNKILKFTFGHSHINYIFINFKKVKIKKLGKYKYIIKSKNKFILNKLSKDICKIRSINLFTKRGIRLGRQVVFKRKGKKSTYI